MTATDRAVDRLIEAAPAAAGHVVRYMTVVGWAEFTGGAVALAAMAWLFRVAWKKSDDRDGLLIIGAIIVAIPGILAFVALIEGATILLAPEGAAIMRALP